MSDCHFNTIVGGFILVTILVVLWSCKSALQKHRNAAIPVEPFKCPHCGYMELVVTAQQQ